MADVSALLDSIESEANACAGLIEVEDTDDGDSGLGRDSSDPVSRFINLVVYQAVVDSATDIYFELHDRQSSIRYRVNGSLYEMAPPPSRLMLPIANELKLRFGLIKELKDEEPKGFFKRLSSRLRETPYKEPEYVPKGYVGFDNVPQLEFMVAGKKVNISLSRIPVEGHDNYHLEVFEQKNLPIALDKGIEAILERKGIVLISSLPDGGKTTVGYQAMNYLNRPASMSVIVQPKGAYSLAGVNKVQTAPGSPDFQQKLFAVSAYAPDVVMFDDVNDPSLVRELMRYASQGKRVIAAVSARDNAAARNVLIDLGAEAAALDSLLVGMVNVKLVPIKHDPCKGDGCRECKDTGYIGKKAEYTVNPGK